jgi:hypothetical protein
MSIAGDILAAGRSVRNSVFGPHVVEYRATAGTGEWTALTGTVWREMAGRREFDADRATTYWIQEANLEVAEDAPVLQEGYEIRIGSDDARVWSVHEQVTLNAQGVYRCVKEKPLSYGDDRGRTI